VGIIDDYYRPYLSSYPIKWDPIVVPKEALADIKLEEAEYPRYALRSENSKCYTCTIPTQLHFERDKGDSVPLCDGCVCSQFGYEKIAGKGWRKDARWLRLIDTTILRKSDEV
jgi:hypothetical protein